MSRNNRSKRNNEMKKKSKIIRCKEHNRPVFGHEVCSLFSPRSSSNTHKSCENCAKSF